MLYLGLYVITVSVVAVALKIFLGKTSAANMLVFAAFGMLTVALISYLTHRAVSFSLSGYLIGVGMACGLAFYVLALERLSLGFVMVVSNLYWVPVVILSIVFLRERFTLLQFLGIALTVIGVSLVLFRH